MLPHGRLHDFGTVPFFLAGAGIMLVGFFLALRVGVQSVAWFWVVAVAVRGILVFQVPGDDIHRYVWEGGILGAGWNPYVHPPEAESIAALRDTVWESVQHRSITAIYPPLAQIGLAIMAFIWPSQTFFKVVFAVADLVVVGLLARRFGVRRAVLYAWNPLVIYVFAGGGHYDSIFVLALVLAWFAWIDGRIRASVLFFGVAVALKWLALPLLAWACWQAGGWRKPARTAALVAIGASPLIASYLAVSLWTAEWTLNLLPQGFSQYARSAEFIPGVVGWIWEQSQYHNHWFLVPLGIAWAVVILRVRKIERAAEWLFFLTYIFTPLLHAWYFVWVMPFAVLTRNAGAVVLSLTGWVYFMLYHHVESPAGTWRLPVPETLLLWLPYVVAFLWSEIRGKREVL